VALPRTPHIQHPLVRIVLFAAMVALWNLVSRSEKPASLSWFLLAVSPSLIPIVVLVGRRNLDRNPSASNVPRVTFVVHYSVLTLLGLGVFEGARFLPDHPIWEFPVLTPAAMVLTVTTGALLATSLLNLAVTGLGAPFALALTRKLSTDWMCCYTRNPMLLLTICFLVSVGLALRAFLFLAWTLALLTPAWIYLVRVYEERELEFRFGGAYRHYRSRSPFLLPSRLKAELPESPNSVQGGLS
jgi:protein-S-isoprenylcysteine O-methyltransferase Ste14